MEKERRLQVDDEKQKVEVWYRKRRRRGTELSDDGRNENKPRGTTVHIFWPITLSSISNCSKVSTSIQKLNRFFSLPGMLSRVLNFFEEWLTTLINLSFISWLWLWLHTNELIASPFLLLQQASCWSSTYFCSYWHRCAVPDHIGNVKSWDSHVKKSVWGNQKCIQVWYISMTVRCVNALSDSNIYQCQVNHVRRFSCILCPNCEAPSVAVFREDWAEGQYYGRLWYLPSLTI